MCPSGMVGACVRALSFICVIVCGLFEWKRICAGFFSRLLIYVLPLEIQLSRGRVGVPLAGLIPRTSVLAYPAVYNEFS